MKKTFLFAVLLMLTAGLCACALADDWTCPQCGRENREDMNFCGNCRTERPAEYCPVTSAMINAWVCSACGHVCPEEDHFCTKCGADHYAADPKAVLTARPVLDEVLMPPVSVRRISCSHNNDSTTIDYTASVEGKHIFWTEDQTRDFSGRMRLYDGNGRKLRANDFYCNEPGLSYRLSAGETYRIVVQGRDSKDPHFTLCIGEPREPVQINARSIIRDSVDCDGQENTYLFIPQIAGEYRLDVAEIQSGQELDLRVQDELGYVLGSSGSGVSMGNGISFELEAGKPYYIIAEQRTGPNGKDLGTYKLQLSSPNPVVSVSGCDAVGDHLYYRHQKNTYEYTAPETGTYVFPLTRYSTCDFTVRILDEYGYTLGRSDHSDDCRADLAAGKSYQIVVEQNSGFGDYSLFIQKAE